MKRHTKQYIFIICGAAIQDLVTFRADYVKIGYYKYYDLYA